ncbi:MAG: N-formylglutamate amidohydrolase [Rhodospirillales bacterium]|jgi:predicted N-formylglutamate amidohydrolase
MPAFDIVNPDAAFPLLLICDHASNAVPPELGGLGLLPDDLQRHIAWDIGAAEVTRELSRLMNATALLGAVSRLVIDLNRPPDDASAIPAISDGSLIPGNQGLTSFGIQRRVQTYFAPYHDAIAGEIRRLKNPALVSVHSFTPVMNDQPRPWQIGVLWNRDGRLALPLIEALRREPGLLVGDNEPYSGRDLAYSMNIHAGAAGLLHAGIEIRQDLIDTPEKAQDWARRLARILKPLVPS